MKTTNEELKEAKEKLLRWLEESNFKVFVSFKGVSRSGMLRRFNVYSFYIEKETGELRKLFLNWYIAKVTRVANQDKKDDTLKVSGCGMDMAYHLITSLSRALYGDENKLKYEML